MKYISLYIYVYIYTPHFIYPFIYSSISGHLGCFHFLVIVNYVAMNIEVHKSFPISVFIYFI